VAAASVRSSRIALDLTSVAPEPMVRAMPRRRAPPRLYLDPTRRDWVIRDGAAFIRTGLPEHERAAAERRLAEYLTQKHVPEVGPDPLICDVIGIYASEHLPHTKSARNASYSLMNLIEWWGTRRVSAVTAASCREYARGRSPSMARRDLETLRAATRFYHREAGPLSALPTVVLPPKAEPRDRWLTRSEAARLLWAARRQQHLRRFILLALHTGSRSNAILGMQWSWIDLRAGVMRRRAPGEIEDAKKRSPEVRLGRRIISHLRRWRRLDGAAGDKGYVCHYDGRRIQKFRASWATVLQRSGLERVTPHTLRHTRATWLMQAGVPVWEAAGHLGMSVEMLTRQYAKHHPDWQKRAAEV
jgi:integrase